MFRPSLGQLKAGALPFAAAIGFGLVGSALAHLVALPMPWMLGTMFGTACASLLGFRVEVYHSLRMGMVAVLGVLLGSSFTPQFLEGIGGNLLTILLLLVYTVVTTAFIFICLRNTTRIDRVTAFFSAVPGGVNEMTIMGSERGGHEASLAVHHSLRLILVIFTVSVVFAIAFHYTRQAPASLGMPVFAPADYILIGLLALGGLAFARAVRMPAAFILGPMVVSAAAHIAGFTDVKPDAIIVAVAQTVCGAALGARFATLSRSALMSAASTAVLIAVLLMLFTLAYVWGVSFVLDRPFPVLLLAFSPGGLTEMGLIALSMGADTAFVSLSQVARFFIVVTTATPMYRVLQLISERRPEPGGAP